MRSLLLVLSIVLLLPTTGAFSQKSPTTADLTRPLPMDAKIRTGTLRNGMTYYLRQNARPAGRVELRLAVNAGSILENDDQQGLAHFLEHMCFNGSKNFQKTELVSFMESIGMRFGGDVNASTSFDETTYMLQAPTDKPDILDKSFQIMEDWAHLVSLEGEEIDKERGVIIEEWRQGRGADARMRDRQYPILYRGSRYAERMPIGKKEILESFTHDKIRSFYKDWYRPDLMAIAVVGDLDLAKMEELVRRHFEGIPATTAPRKRELFTVPFHKETVYAIATDPEATRTNVSIHFKRPVQEFRTVGDFRRGLVESLYNGMFNARLRELAQKADPPYLSAMSMSGRSLRTVSSYIMSISVPEGGVLRGLGAAMVEAERVRRFGFTATELERQKAEQLRQFESAVKEKDKTESRMWVTACVRHFLRGDALTDEDTELALCNQVLPGITLEEINALAKELMTTENRVVLASGPQKDGKPFPSEAELARAMEDAKAQPIDAYVDKVITTPLVEKTPTPGRVTKESSIPALGVTEWVLSNGVRVLLKPTDFKNDEVLFSAYSPGGTSKVGPAQLLSATLAPGIVQEGGLGQFPQTELRKYLTGRIVRVNPVVRELFEGITGTASPQDLETMFTLIHLYFTAPRKDADAFTSYRKRLAGALHNRSAQPESALEDTLLVTTSQYNPRRTPVTEERLETVSLDEAMASYTDRFADAGDFTFTIVGAFTPQAIRPLVETWLGGLPATGRRESWVDPKVEFPTAGVSKEVRKGLEPKSAVRFVMSNPLEWRTEERFALNAAIAILRITLREAVREEKGGTYGVAVSSSLERWPQPRCTVSIGFGCNPDRVGELLQTVRTEIAALRNAPVDATYLAKYREQALRQREVNLKENGFWLSALETFAQQGEDPQDILRYEDHVKAVTVEQVQAAAQKYFTADKAVQVVLRPE